MKKEPTKSKGLIHPVQKSMRKIPAWKPFVCSPNLDNKVCVCFFSGVEGAGAHLNHRVLPKTPKVHSGFSGLAMFYFRAVF